MNLREALSAAVDGERVRAVDMQAGSYVDYQFAGWRRNFAGGASSGFTPTPHDEEVEWEIFVPEPKKDAWGRVPVPNSVVVTHEPAPIVERSWGEVFSDKQPVEGGWRDKKPPPNQPADADKRWATLIAETPSPKPATDKWGRKC